MGDGSGDGVALVTGGSRGIGRAVVEGLLEERYRVWLCSRRRESVQQALEELRSRAGDRVDGAAVDVRDQRQVEGFVARVEAEAGRVDCLVNNAGIGMFAPVDEISGDDWREVVETNLCGAFYCIRAVAPAMKRRGSGFIVNVVSLAGKNPFAGGAAYNASKFGMVGLSEAAMLDLRHSGVRVAAVLPGSVETGFRHPTESPSGWKLTPGDVARAVVDLLRYPERALASLVELRPTRPPKK